MSYGPLAGMHFNVNQTAETPGIFWQRNKSKQEPKKFGYKSKKLRHPIRQPDEEAALETLEASKEADKRKYNRNNKNFIQNNKNRVTHKDDQKASNHQTGTEIKPGTVTLTQEQLAALLASLGKTKTRDNPMKISIDASTNKIEVEQYESDDETRTHKEDHRNDDDDDDDDDVGIAAFLNNDRDTSKQGKSKTKERRAEPQRHRQDRSGEHQHRADRSQDGASAGQSRDRHSRPGASRETQAAENATVPQISREEPSSRLHPPRGQAETRLSWEDAKKEAGMAHVPDVIPWKHLTVGEKKRLQWARERAETAEDYNPWGRPGAGAPPKKAEDSNPSQQKQEQTSHTPIVPDVKKQREILEEEIEKLRLEIQEAEARKKKREEARTTESKEKKDLEEEQDQKDDRREEKIRIERKEGRKKDRKEAEAPKKDTRGRKAEADEHDGNKEVQIVIVTKKRSKGGEEEDDVVEVRKSVEESPPPTPTKQRKEKRRRERRESESEESLYSSSQPQQVSESKDREKGSDRSQQDGTSQAQRADDAGHLSKKELERRQWLAELNKQREEQRMRKQQEKEQERQGIHDQWADRFVYHKCIEQVSPRVRKSEEAPTLGKASEDVSSTFTPPVAMRSALVVGAGTLNEKRFDNKKAEEKRKWLDELDRQREEQRQARQNQKDRDRAEDGTWADHYPSDYQKLRQTNNILDKVGPSPRETATWVASTIEPPRTSSAPGTTMALTEDEEAPTFLRGQGVFVDPVTRKEQEEKRRIYLEYQAQVKAQIEEKERQKRQERERKMREDMEEERRLQQERDAFQNQLEQEQRRLKDKEEQRQRQIEGLKLAMDEAEERAQEAKNNRRLHHLAQMGHDVAHLKATYDVVHNTATATPRKKTYNTSAIPGLDGLEAYHPQPHTFPSPPPVIDERPLRGGNRPAAMGQSYTKERHIPELDKEPYMENRVLTPSRFRSPSKPSNNPNSPLREFGTQTLELKDLQSILQSLPDEVQIEYKMKVEEALKDKEQEYRRRHPPPNRKVHAKSADDHERPGQAKKPDGNPRLPRKKDKRVEQVPEVEVKKTMKCNERPKWNQNQKRTVMKNSEKDPFYHQRKEEKEQRKAKRERQLQYLQELNRQRIPAQSKSPGRNRDASPESKQPAGVERGRQPAARALREPQRQNRDASPNVLSLLHEGELATGRSSPPIPTVRHRTGTRGTDTDRDPYLYANSHLRNSQTDTRYGDAVISPIGDGEFLPFMRTTEILDPSKADDPMAISRENSRMERARRAYRDTHNPANKGRRLDIYQDKEREAAMKASQDPILNPSVVTDNPTGRQDRILQQLSSLKQTLMERQKELETHMSTEDEHKI